MVLDRSAPAMHPLGQPREAEFGAQRHELVARYSSPRQRVELAADLGVAVQGRQPAVQQGVGALLAEGGGEALRVADGGVPGPRRLRDRLDPPEASEHGGRALRSPAGETREAVRAVADEGQVVGDGCRRGPELGDPPGLLLGCLPPPRPRRGPPPRRAPAGARASSASSSTIAQVVTPRQRSARSASSNWASRAGSTPALLL